jgi:hypothetical protein
MLFVGTAKSPELVHSRIFAAKEGRAMRVEVKPGCTRNAAAGWKLLSLGGGVASAGAALIPAGFATIGDRPPDKPMIIAGGVMLGTGLIAAASGLPMMLRARVHARGVQ